MAEYRNIYRGAGMVQWWERWPPTAVAWVLFPDPASHVGWVCCWFSSLLWGFFLRVLRFSSLHKNQHFWILIRSGNSGWRATSWKCHSKFHYYYYYCYYYFYPDPSRPIHSVHSWALMSATSQVLKHMLNWNRIYADRWICCLMWTLQ